MQEAIQYIRTALSDIYPEQELGSVVNILISEITGYTRTQILLNKNTKISEKQHNLLISFVEELKLNRPIQYVIGKAEFYGLEFNVGPGVLIPRPETEELVDWVNSTLVHATKNSLLDIGTGSGCIAIALKWLMPEINITAFDISENALDIAKLNANKNNCEINFVCQDIFTLMKTPIVWDVIVSNPPYVPESEKAQILPNVLDFEPHLALFVPDSNPLVFYDKIADFGCKHLNTDGYLFFEIHRDFGSQTIKLLQDYGYKNIELRKDISGNDRMIKAQHS